MKPTMKTGKILQTAVIFGVILIGSASLVYAAGGAKPKPHKDDVHKKTITVYFSVLPCGMPTNFNASEVQDMLQTQLSGNVFNDLDAGESVKVIVRVESHCAGTLGWNSCHSIYTNQVNWGFVGNHAAYHDNRGVISMNAHNSYSDPTQAYSNLFAHEGIWGNACDISDGWWPWTHDVISLLKINLEINLTLLSEATD